VPARPLSTCLTAAQLQALAAKGIVSTDITDTSCVSGLLNTCGRDATSLLSEYPVYDSTRGVYTAWGEIPLPWEFENTLSDERWQVSRYVDEFGYRTGDQVLVIGNDGHLVTLYTATADGPAPAGPFDSGLWTEVCQVTTSTPTGLPDISTLLSQYEYYDPRSNLTRWGEFASGWGDDLTDPDSDEWNTARIAKNFFYRIGDIVLYDVRCGDYTCAYIATTDMPSNPELIMPGPPPADYFNKLYCVANGRESKCTKRVTCGPGRVVVDLSTGDRDLVCVPVESTTGVGPYVN
jgi:hypothetical protein